MTLNSYFIGKYGSKRYLCRSLKGVWSLEKFRHAKFFSTMQELDQAILEYNAQVNSEPNSTLTMFGFEVIEIRMPVKTTV